MLSILRLASAVAKLKLADSVTRDDVQEAMRLVEMSKDSLKGTKAKKKRRQRPSDMIYQEIREMLPPATGQVSQEFLGFGLVSEKFWVLLKMCRFFQGIIDFRLI